jgi:hypothetical protein
LPCCILTPDQLIPPHKPWFLEDAELHKGDQKTIFSAEERGCSQFSTSAGEISGEDDCVNDYRLSSQPGLTMQGMVDDDLFDIILSEEDD